MRPGTLRTLTACLASLALWAAPAYAQSVQLAPFGGATYGSPYYVTGGAGDAGRVYVVRGNGVIRLVKDGVTQPTSFLDIDADVLDGGERGLFSMALAPDYPASGLFYVFYTRDDTTPGNEHFLVIEEFRRSASNPDVADPATRRIVMEIPHFTAANHNGGQLQFGPDGLLYISVGDGGNTPLMAQELNTRLGKLLRIDPRGSAPFQYSIPADNPFADGGGPNADEIYALGLRNPYRFSFDRYTGDVIIGDVGGGTYEEINFATEGAARGVNFGWPCYEGELPYFTTGPCSSPISNTLPAHKYGHSGSGMFGAAAVNAGYVIRDPALPGLNGRFEYTDTYGEVPGVRTVLLSSTGSSGDASLGVNPDNLVYTSGQDACGHIYIGQAGSGGTVSRLEPTSGPFPCKTTPAMSADAGGPGATLRRGGIPVTVSCDVDCNAVATASIAIFGKPAKSKRTSLAPGPVSQRVQLGTTAELLLVLTKKQRKRLKRAIKGNARAKRVRLDVAVTATGAGGGSAHASDSSSLKPKKKRKRKRR
jgi:hypothetical protein